MPSPEPSSPIRAVVVGYGVAGQRIHAPLVQLERGLILHGVCSGDVAKRQAIGSQLGCRTYEAFDQVIADPAVQLVILATPNTLHASQAIAALSAGKHVVVDKPVCLSLEDFDRMYAAARQAGRILRVFHNRRLDGDFLTVQQLMQQGVLGRLSWMELSWQKYGLPRTWRQSAAEGGGRLVDLGSHMIDQALILNPSPVQSVFCRQHREFEGSDVESHSMLSLMFSGGATAIIDTSSSTRIPKPRYVLVGQDATFVKYGVDPQEAALAAGDLDAAKEDPAQYGQLDDGRSRQVVLTLPGRWRDYYAGVAMAIASGAAGRPDPAADDEQKRLRMQVAVLLAAAESARSGAVIAVN